MVAVATSKVRRTHRQIHALTWEFALRVYGRLELVNVAGNKITQSLSIIALSAEALHRVLVSSDRREALAAFAEKRKPKFEGK